MAPAKSLNPAYLKRISKRWKRTDKSTYDHTPSLLQPEHIDLNIHPHLLQLLPTHLPNLGLQIPGKQAELTCTRLILDRAPPRQLPQFRTRELSRERGEIGHPEARQLPHYDIQCLDAWDGYACGG
jgi:hypothetical protein